MADDAIRREVERRTGRSFDAVKAQLIELFDLPWDDVETVIETSADKKNRTEADVVCELLAKAEEKPSAAGTVKRAVIRWIGKPWRERENPWAKYEERVPPSRREPSIGDPPPTDEAGAEWEPFRAGGDD